MVAVTQMPAEWAGSSRNRRRPSGISTPETTPMSTLLRMATAITSPSQAFPRQTNATAPTTRPNTMPIREPTNISCHQTGCVLQINASQSHEPDHDGHGLNAGIAAKGGDHGRKHRQDRDPSQCELESRDDECSEKYSEQIDAQPWQAKAHGPAYSPEVLVLVDANHPEHVLGRLVLEYVDQIVVGNHSEHSVIVVDHRKSQQIVVLQEASRLLLVGLGLTETTGRSTT